jgi:hypothetical protein
MRNSVKWLKSRDIVRLVIDSFRSWHTNWP